MSKARTTTRNKTTHTQNFFFFSTRFSNACGYVEILGNCTANNFQYTNRLWICVSSHLADSIFIRYHLLCVCLQMEQQQFVKKLWPVANANTSNTQLLIINSFLIKTIRNEAAAAQQKRRNTNNNKTAVTKNTFNWNRTRCSPILFSILLALVVKSHKNSSFPLPNANGIRYKYRNFVCAKI